MEGSERKIVNCQIFEKAANHGLIFLSLFPHFLQDWDHLVERRPLRRVFVHTNLDEFAHVVADAGWNVHPETFSGDLYASFHGRQFGEGRFSRGHFPKEDGEAPHVRRLRVDLFGAFG